MKAIRKSDGKIIDVEVHGWQGDCAVSYHTNFKNFYKPEDLDFNVVETKDVGTTEKPFDWQSFRNQAAKDILSNALIPHALQQFDEVTVYDEDVLDSKITHWTPIPSLEGGEK